MKYIYRSQLKNVYGQASTKPGKPRAGEKAVVSDVESVEMGTIENARYTYKEHGVTRLHTHTFDVFQCN